MSWSLSLQVRLGELALDASLAGGDGTTCVVGPNGAGKTTLFRLLAGGLRPDAGRVVVDDRVLLDTVQGVDLPPESRRVGYVPQGYALFPHLSVVDNVAFGLASGGASRRSRRTQAVALLAALGCAELAERRPSGLSGGEQQRVAIARALAVAPVLMLLDEPLAALDAASRRRMRTTLSDHLATLARPALVITHDLRDVLALGGQVAVLEDGRVVQTGTAHALAEQPATDFVAEFFGSDPRLSSPQGGPLPSERGGL